MTPAAEIAGPVFGNARIDTRAACPTCCGARRVLTYRTNELPKEVDCPTCEGSGRAPAALP